MKNNNVPEVGLLGNLFLIVFLFVVFVLFVGNILKKEKEAKKLLTDIFGGVFDLIIDVVRFCFLGIINILKKANKWLQRKYPKITVVSYGLIITATVVLLIRSC